MWKVTFKYKECLFKWLAMPFNLTNVPTIFMRIMEDILYPFTNSFVFVLLEIILIFKRIQEEYLKHTMTTKAIHQPGEVLIWRLEDSMFGVHCG
jgi:hypothetical protein